MKKFLVIIIFFVACGSNSEETLPTTSTTLNPDLRNLNITVYDDTVNDEYELIKVRITYPDKYTWTPDLEYGSDSIPISRFEIGQIGNFSLFYDSENNEIPVCFSPTDDSTGDLGTIYIVLNDNNIEIDGLAVQDIVINRNSGRINLLEDSSKPYC